MARLPRYTLPGQPQHVIQRGNNRSVLFAAEIDYQFFRDCLKVACAQHGCTIHAYVLMTNHGHLLMTPANETSIGKAMQSLGRRYVQYFNYTYQRTGTLWPLPRIRAPGRSRPPASRGITTSLCGAAFVPPCTSGRPLQSHPHRRRTLPADALPLYRAQSRCERL